MLQSVKRRKPKLNEAIEVKIMEWSEQANRTFQIDFNLCFAKTIHVGSSPIQLFFLLFEAFPTFNQTDLTELKFPMTLINQTLNRKWATRHVPSTFPTL